MNLRKKWLSHLQENNMTYTDHMVFALLYGIRCILTGICLIIHSILPCFFTKAGTNLTYDLNKSFSSKN